MASGNPSPPHPPGFYPSGPSNAAQNGVGTATAPTRVDPQGMETTIRQAAGPCAVRSPAVSQCQPLEPGVHAIYPSSMILNHMPVPPLRGLYLLALATWPGHPVTMKHSS